MKILMVGARGMLGQALLSELRIKNKELGIHHEVLGLDLAELDITKEVDVQQKLAEFKPEVVINTAAYNDVDGAEKNPELARLINSTAVGYLAKACNEVGALLVHYSTDYVFPGDRPQGYNENDTPAPVSIYGQSKYGGEQAAAQAKKYYLIRTSRLFGKSGTGPTAKRSFIEAVIKKSTEVPELTMVDEEMSSPTYVVDLAKATLGLLESTHPYGLYHRTNSGACTWYGFGLELQKLGVVKTPMVPVSGNVFPRPAKRPKFSELITTKLPPLRSWQEALADFLK